MSRFQDLPKAYDASSVEDAIYASWEMSNAFNPDKLPGTRPDPYCIVMPPPNRTGTLHVGHAVMLAIEDLMIRFQRMRGKKALWIPGTDHAAIATQVKVEQLLREQGMKDPKKELGREKFLEKVISFAEESAATIRNQVRKMGSSCDWTREKYTLDAERNRAVVEMFRRMHEDGLIERGDRIVNWDPQSKTVVSDDEIVWIDEKAPFYTFKYGPFEIGTSRPETKFGDKYVVMHPEDPRYASFEQGQKIELEWINGPITATVVKDSVIDREFGTGVMTITPWHDNVDYELAERHALDREQIIDLEGRLLPIAGEFAGLPILEARKKVVEKLKQKGLLVNVDENYAHRIATSQRGGGLIEPQILRQWFVRVTKPFALRQDTLGKWKKGDQVTLKELMRHAVESGQTKIVPERFTKIYYHWIDNLRDWCISRQIWFGHRIPVWYREPGTGNGEPGTGNREPGTGNEEPEIRVSDVSPGAGWDQDPDTLDTWFSSGLWTFSTLGWPDEKEWNKNRAYHPTAVLETGYDILFFWIARMVLMSAYALGEVPFRDAYLHGLIRDEQGRKMSKSLGNVIDPLDVIPKYGTDAVRLSLVMGTTPGQDVRLSEAKIEGFRNFTNKLWNISRFILMQIGEPGTGNREPKTLADRWILSRLDEVAASVTSKIEKYEFSSAGEELRDYTWGYLADWYLEIAKVEKGKDAILAHLLRHVLILWHPFMPFVTEHIWKTAGFDGQLIVASWSQVRAQHAAPVQEFEVLRQLVTDMRRLRADQGVEAAKQVEIALVASSDVKKLVEENMEVVKHLARAASVAFVGAVAFGWATTVSGSATIGLNVAGSVDIVKEKDKAQKEIDATRKYVESLNVQLANGEFTSKAPASVISGMKLKLSEAEMKLKTLEEKVKRLG
ncbi:valine--tRNA ligase [Candidatus Uhrbacteria bacterium RIFCSPHIGHO2_12_FULL_60_25]|uniref:Valine--tRNA ligase n=1 Tax=Candidatus Uhrbacteria bacterium RIFCSPHIGHO2_12_FULL_60_25 TaxID=1802399 RepID=A0A1F7UPG1_9BACT|nr:MAG: valine--tRNA ligase [Candidatus Uhrbacteria bacterium RIFCSPHIGHO2_12_FULL_60_25]